jgi:APA family basic amino acid/polyamine antiporter
MSSLPSQAPGTLSRRLGPADAVALGLGGMIGTGVFVVAGPATAEAGRWVLGSLLLAAAVAACNATSAARLAARFPVSGGAYHWGRELLHPVLGSLAGWCFVAGKVASSAAAALTVGLSVAAAGGTDARFLVTATGIAVVVVVTTANVLGVRRTAAASRWLVAVVVAVLAAVAVAALLTGPGGPIGPATPPASGPGAAPGLGGGLVAAGLFFLAFAGYARIATLGEEVRDPARTIPLAVAAAFGVSLALYLLVVSAALAVLGVAALAATRTPVADLAAGVGGPATAAVAVAGVAAATAVALGVQAGVSRVLLAMSRTGELPGPLGRVHPARGTPYRADLVVGVGVAAVVATGGVVAAVAVSAATVLVYYAVANAAALRLPGRAGRVVAVAGLVGCLVLVGALAWSAVR